MSATENTAVDWNYPGLLQYVHTLEAWYAAEVNRAFDEAVPPDGLHRLCLGMIVYGSYVDRFLELSMPSLLAPGNLGCLYDPMVIIHTDEANVEKLQKGTAPLAEFARVQIRIIPPILLELVEENVANKYWILGAAHNIHMQQAKYQGHAYHMLMPDHVYAMGYFDNLDRLRTKGAKAIVQTNVSAKMEAVAPILKEKKFFIAPKEMTKLSVEHMHDQVLPFLINGRTDLPASLLLVMIGEKEVQIICPHMSIVYLSHDLLMRLSKPRHPNTIDGQLPFFIPDDVEPVVPGPEDGMVYMEVSDVNKPAYFKAQGHTLEEFTAKFWTVSYCVKSNFRFFNLTTRLPFPEGYKPKIPPMSDLEIEMMKDHVRAGVKKSYEPVKFALPYDYRTDPLERSREIWS